MSVKPDWSTTSPMEMKMGSLDKMVYGTNLEESDVLEVDKPHDLGGVPFTLSHTVDVAKAVVVSTTQKIDMADAKKGEEMYSKVEDIATMLSKVYKWVEDCKSLYNLDDYLHLFNVSQC